MSVELASVNTHMSNVHHRPLTRVQLAVILLATAMIAADRYYCQPLLAEMSRSLHLTPSVIGFVPALTQAGIAFGLLLLVPLGDMVELRRLNLVLLFALGCALALTGAAVNAPMLFAASLLIGLFASASQLLVGLAATLAEPSQRGQVVGTVTAGLLIGVFRREQLRVSSGVHLGGFDRGGWDVRFNAHHGSRPAAHPPQACDWLSADRLVTPRTGSRAARIARGGFRGPSRWNRERGTRYVSGPGLSRRDLYGRVQRRKTYRFLGQSECATLR